MSGEQSEKVGGEGIGERGRGEQHVHQSWAMERLMNEGYSPRLPVRELRLLKLLKARRNAGQLMFYIFIFG